MTMLVSLLLFYVVRNYATTYNDTNTVIRHCHQTPANIA